jgi:hypothetical protein
MATVGTSAASAATYYATPNPNPGAACTQADPCAIEQAVAAPPNSEVVILPGDYTVSNGLNTLNTADVHGVAGQPRPRISSTYEFPAWALGGFSAPTITLRHIELETTGGTGLAPSGTGTTTIEDVVVNATGTSGAGCAPAGSTGSIITIKNSICRGENRGIGTNCAGCNSTVAIRNATAIGGTYGIAFSATPGSTSDFTVNATNVIARHTGGTGADVRAEVGSTNSDVAVNLSYSNYATREQVLCMTPPCTATVTDPTMANNQTAAPLFANAAAGDFHQAPGSPTVGAGINDAQNGTADIDAQQRQIDTVDIGADELGRATSTSVSCSPGSTSPGSGVNCTATVTDPGAAPTAPTGIVAFSSSGAGSFGSVCTLSPTATPGQSTCAVSYLPSQAGSHQITATSSRDLLHEGSQGAFLLGVTAPPSPATPAAPAAPAANPTSKKRCKKRKKRAGAAATRCKKKKR